MEHDDVGNTPATRQFHSGTLFLESGLADGRVTVLQVRVLGYIHLLEEARQV